jgi:peroxygenase
MTDVGLTHRRNNPPTSINAAIDATTENMTSQGRTATEGSDRIKDAIMSTKGKPLTALQQHVLFWDPDNDSIIWPSDIYNGFRDLGFSIPFSILALLIPIYFSYPTTLGHSWLPDPFFRIYLSSIHKAKHGSDTGIYDLGGNFRNERFEEMWERFDTDGAGGLGVGNLWHLLAKDRVAADPAGWSFAFMEWGTTWLLLQKMVEFGRRT